MSLAACVLAACTAGRPAAPSPAGVDGPPPAAGDAAGSAVPAAAVRALRVQTPDGAPATLGTHLGTAPAVVSFWATYCLPCRLEVPVLARAADRLARLGVRLLAVATDGGDPARVAAAVEAWGMSYGTLIALPGQQDHLARLLPGGLPATMVVGPRGAVRRDALLDDAALDALVRTHLQEAPGPPER